MARTLHLTLLILFACARPVGAEEAEHGNDEEERVRAEARGRFDRGVELFNLGDHEAALAEFTRAYELLPAHVVLFNIGQVNAGLGDYPAAVVAYERFLSEGGDSVSDEQRQQVERLLETLRGRIGHIHVSVAGDVEATILLEGAEVGRSPLAEPLVVRSGAHRIEARAEGYLPATRDVTVAGGETVRIELELSSSVEAPGGIQVSVNVVDVTVSLDGEVVGTTPLREHISTQPGTHLIDVTRPGYDGLRREVNVVAGRVTRTSFELRPSDPIPNDVAGRLEVAVSEDDAEVLLDGYLFRDGTVPVGTHRLEIRREGFERWSELVEVDDSPLTRVVATLAPARARREQYLRRASGVRAGAYAALATAVASLAVAAGLFAWNGSRYDQWQATDESIRRNYDGVSSDGEDLFDLSDPDAVASLWRATIANNNLIDQIHTVARASWALVGIGSAAAVAATLMLVFGPRLSRYSRARSAATLVVGPRGGGLSIAW